MVGDEAQLYQTLAPRLERIVRSEVRTSEEVVADACHHAWTQLINHSERIERDAALTWLARTAIRQAWKLDRRERRDLSLEGTSEDIGELPLASPAPGPPEQADLREQLSIVESLPARQRRLIWLRAAGLSYVEMAAYTGDTTRTVERQVLRATNRVRQLHAEREDTVQELAEAPVPIHGPGLAWRPLQRDERGLER